jgi:hypothetical protein
MRDLFRRYLDSRIEAYRKVPQMEAVKGPSADAAPARAERDVRHHHDSDGSCWSSSAGDYLCDARRADSRVFVVRGLRYGDTASSERVALRRLRCRLVGDCVRDHRSRVSAPWIYPGERFGPGACRFA